MPHMGILTAAEADSFVAKVPHRPFFLRIAGVDLPLLLAATAAQAQTVPDDQQQMQEVIITGSRIIQSSANAQQPLSIIDRNAIERTGLASIGDLLQQVTTGGKALNTKFNSSGNF